MQLPNQTIKKMRKNKKTLEKKLKLKIQIKDNEIELEGEQTDIYIGEKILEAIDKNFPIKTALLLLNENYVLEDIPIKSISNRNLSRIKARIIGTKGKTLKVLCRLSSCHITLHNNTVSIIGEAENIKEVMTAIENLIRGSKQSNVYHYLEKSRKKPEQGFGLKH